MHTIAHDGVAVSTNGNGNAVTDVSIASDKKTINIADALNVSAAVGTGLYKDGSELRINYFSGNLNESLGSNGCLPVNAKTVYDFVSLYVSQALSAFGTSH